MNNINLLQFRGLDATDTQLFATDDGILSFDLDWNRDWLYWANQTGHIQRTRLTRVKPEVVPTPVAGQSSPARGSGADLQIQHPVSFQLLLLL